MIRVARSIAVLGGIAAMAACSKGGNAADSAAAADSASRAAAAAAPPTPTAAPLNDANVAAMIDEINMADSASGNLASTKGTNASVKDFGKMMMRDHHNLRQQGQQVATKASLTPTPPAGDTLPQHAQKMGDSLNALAKGADWDKSYIGHEVEMHTAALATLQSAQGLVQDTTLKALITKAIPNVQAHLTKAQDIQSKLGGASAAGGAAAATPGATPAKGDTAGKKKP